jgi:hypothetical protein
MLFNPSTIRQQDLVGQAVIRAELIGSRTAIAGDIVAVAYAPVLELARQLVLAGHDPASRLEAYRGSMLCLRIRSIGEAAELEINSKGTDLVPRRAVRTGSPIHSNGGEGL